MALQAEPDQKTKGLVKASIYINKRKDISEEEFHRYWSEDHGSLINSIPYFKKNMIKYNQYHNDISARKTAASLGLSVMEFDGAAEVWAADLDTLLGFIHDPEYLEKIVPDEGKFVDRESIKFMIGYDDLKMDKTN